MSILIIGGGKMGFSHSALLSSYLGKEKIAICDNNLIVRIIYLFLGFRVFKSINDAFRILNKISGVVISTPTSSHYKLTKIVIQKKIPCFVEKPLTLDKSKSLELLKLSEEFNTYVQLGFVMRYVATFHNLKKIILSSKFGNIVSYKASMFGNVITRTPPADSWRGNFSKGGGCLNEYGPHLIDLILYLFGNVNHIHSCSYDKIFCDKADDSCKFELEHHNNVIGLVNLNWADTKQRKSVIKLEVNFEKLSLYVDNSTIDIIDSCHLSNINTVDLSIFKSLPFNVKFYLRGEEFSREIEDFLEKCFDQKFSQDNFNKSMIPTIRDGCNVDELISIISKKLSIN